MGFPSVGAAAYYRNPLPEVQRFFETRHAGHYKIYNLCSERGYELENYFPTTERFPFKDHNPPEVRNCPGGFLLCTPDPEEFVGMAGPDGHDPPVLSKRR